MKKHFPTLFIFLVVVYLLFLIRPAWLGQLGGTFKPKKVPEEYVELKDFLYGQKEFFRTLWIPKRERFSFSSDIHPAIEASQLFKTSSQSAIINFLKKSETKILLKELSVKYVIIPYDSLGELFLKDGKYDQVKRDKIEQDLRMVKWLKWLDGWEKIAIFETTGFKDRFFINSLTRELVNSLIKWRMVNSTKYEVEVKNANRPFTLVFSESFNPFWVAISNGEIINSERTIHNLNSFRFSKIGNYNLEICFLGQNYLNYGLTISFVTILGLVVALFMLKSKKHDLL